MAALRVRGARLGVRTVFQMMPNRKPKRPMAWVHLSAFTGEGDGSKVEKELRGHWGGAVREASES